VTINALTYEYVSCEGLWQYIALRINSFLELAIVQYSNRITHYNPNLFRKRCVSFGITEHEKPPKPINPKHLFLTYWTLLSMPQIVQRQSSLLLWAYVKRKQKEQVGRRKNCAHRLRFKSHEIFSHSFRLNMFYHLPGLHDSHSFQQLMFSLYGCQPRAQSPHVGKDTWRLTDETCVP
jgi:hypothetical protein